MRRRLIAKAIPLLPQVRVTLDEGKEEAESTTVSSLALTSRLRFQKLKEGQIQMNSLTSYTQLRESLIIKTFQKIRRSSLWHWDWENMHPTGEPTSVPREPRKGRIRSEPSLKWSPSSRKDSYPLLTSKITILSYIAWLKETCLLRIILGSLKNS